MMEKSFNGEFDDSSHRPLDDTNIDIDRIKEENLDILYNIKTELDDEENVSLPFSMMTEITLM